MVLIKKLIVGSMQTNCYLVFDKKTREGIIIDPGDDAEYIEQVVLSSGIVPKLIIATHGHFDHILAVNELQLAFKIPFLINKKDEFLVKSMKKRAEFFLKRKIDLNPIVNRFLEERQEMSVGEGKFIVFATPGHTPGSISLVCKNPKIAFVGDLLFKDGTFGRSDHEYSNSEDLKKSVSKIYSLAKGTVFYPGHGEEFSL